MSVNGELKLTAKTNTTVCLPDVIDNHIEVLLKVASGELPTSHVNGSVALLSDLKERVTHPTPDLTVVQAG